jgi:hypothetical protein
MISRGCAACADHEEARSRADGNGTGLLDRLDSGEALVFGRIYLITTIRRLAVYPSDSSL